MIAATDQSGGRNVPLEQVKRAEWASAGAFVLSAATAIFTGGVVYGQVQSDAVRITTLEHHDDARVVEMTELKVSLAEIRSNVQYLADRAREDRARMDKPTS